MKDTIERILHVLPSDSVVICPCGAALRMSDIHRGIIKCHECGAEHNYHSLEMVSLADFVEKSLKKLDIE